MGTTLEVSRAFVWLPTTVVVLLTFVRPGSASKSDVNHFSLFLNTCFVVFNKYLSLLILSVT